MKVCFKTKWIVLSLCRRLTFVQQFFCSRFISKINLECKKCISDKLLFETVGAANTKISNSKADLVLEHGKS